MKRIGKVSLVILFLIGVLAASGGTSLAQMRPFYGGVYGGYSWPQDMSWQSDSTGENINLEVDNAGVIGFKFGFILPQARMLALEFDYHHLLETNYGPGGNSLVKESGDVYLDNFFFNLILRYPQGRVHPFVGVGIGFSTISFSNVETVGGRSFYQEEYATSFAWQFLAGLNFEIAPNLSADLTYRYFGTDPHLAFVDVEYRTSIFSVGLNFHF
jgi:opacity protein-like surface antigen